MIVTTCRHFELRRPANRVWSTTFQFFPLKCLTTSLFVFGLRTANKQKGLLTDYCAIYAKTCLSTRWTLGLVTHAEKSVVWSCSSNPKWGKSLPCSSSLMGYVFSKVCPDLSRMKQQLFISSLFFTSVKAVRENCDRPIRNRTAPVNMYPPLRMFCTFLFSEHLLAEGIW